MVPEREVAKERSASKDRSDLYQAGSQQTIGLADRFVGWISPGRLSTRRICHVDIPRLL